MQQSLVDELLVELDLLFGLRKVAGNRLDVVGVADEALGPRGRAVRVALLLRGVVIQELTLGAI